MTQYFVNVVADDDKDDPLTSAGFDAQHDDAAFDKARELLPDLITGPGQIGILYTVAAGYEDMRFQRGDYLGEVEVD